MFSVVEIVLSGFKSIYIRIILNTSVTNYLNILLLSSFIKIILSLVDVILHLLGFILFIQKVKLVLIRFNHLIITLVENIYLVITLINELVKLRQYSRESSIIVIKNFLFSGVDILKLLISLGNIINRQFEELDVQFTHFLNERGYVIFTILDRISCLFKLIRTIFVMGEKVTIFIYLLVVLLDSTLSNIKALLNSLSGSIYTKNILFG